VGTWVVALISKTERGEIMARVENGYDVEKYLKSNLDTVKWVSGGPHDDLFIFEVQAGLKNGKSGYDRISGVIRWIEGDSASNIWAKKREGENLDGVRKERITFKKVAESFNSVRNAKFKVGDKVKVKFPRFGYQNGIVTGIVDEPGIKKAYEIDFTNGERYTVAADAVFAANSVRSSNSVVAKALNAVAKFR
jgi:hypothetical protein